MFCCVCLVENSQSFCIFGNEGQTLKVAEIIQKYLWFKPDPDNILTRDICTNCWYKLTDFHEFYQTTEKAHKAYQNNTISNIKNEIPLINLVKLEEDYEIRDNNVHESEEEILHNPTCEIQIINEHDDKNPLEEINNDVSSNTESDEEEYKSSDDYVEEELTSDQDSSEEKEYSCPVSKKQKSRNKSLTNKANIIRKKRMVNRLIPEEVDKIIKKHIPMGCNLCVFVGSTFTDIIDHFKLAHPKIKPYVMCCDRKFKRRFYIGQHALKHENPSFFSCKECSKSFTTSRGLGNHNMRYHPREEDLVYECNQCSKKFARKHILELHKISHIPKEEWKYFCKICPNEKAFASLHLLNIHINMRHKREKNICPVCAKEIKNKKSFEKHVRLHYEDSGPRVKCPYDECDSWLKDEDNLREHLRRHNPESVIHKCDQCNKECKNRRALTTHKRYAHSNETYQCEQCDKTFKKSISLREHMAQHTGETLYKCPFCVKTFNSSSNMHAHKKKMHPIEWNEWRKNKRGSAQKLINSKNPLNPIDETSKEVNEAIKFFS